MKTIEVSIKDFAVAVSRRWLPILIAGLVFTVAIVITNNQAQQSTANLSAILSQEKVSVANKELDQLLIAQKTAEVTASYWDPSKNLTDFLCFGINIDNKSVSEADKTELINRIVNYYIVLVKNASFKEIFKELASTISETDLRYMINVRNDNSIITIETTDILSIDGMLYNERLFQYLNSKTEIVSSATSEHTLDIIQQGTNSSAPQFVNENFAYYTSFVNQGKERIKTLTEIPKIEEARSTSPIIVFIVGVVLASLVVLVIFIIKLPAQLPDQISKQLGVRYLGGVRRKNGVFSSGFEKCLSRHLLQREESEAIRLILANIEESSVSYKSILLTGTIAREAIADFSEKIISTNKNDEIEFTYGGNVNENADSVRKLAGADCVVLVERQNVSKLRDVNRLKERIDGSGKVIFGYVMF